MVLVLWSINNQINLLKTTRKQTDDVLGSRNCVRVPSLLFSRMMSSRIYSKCALHTDQLARRSRGAEVGASAPNNLLVFASFSPIGPPFQLTSLATLNINFVQTGLLEIIQKGCNGIFWPPAPCCLVWKVWQMHTRYFFELVVIHLIDLQLKAEKGVSRRLGCGSYHT